MRGQTSVLHCHHYATLYCQTAEDAAEFGGVRLLYKSAEYTFHDLMASYFEDNGIDAIADRISIVEQYWQFAGMGLLHFKRCGAMSAEAVMEHSHVDRGWIRKWGNRDEPVNHIGQGYLAGAMAAIYGQSSGSFEATETQSIVAGNSESRFTLVRV